MGKSDEENDVLSEDEGNSGYRKGGYHRVYIGEYYNEDQYKIIKKLGWGHFSTVWLAEDTTDNNKLVALKFVKSADNYREAAIDEIELLKTVAKNDPKGKYHIVQFFGDFEHKGPNGDHIVMVFEVLGNNILDLIEKYESGLPIPVIKSITKQILIALEFLHKKCEIIHTDLKPENILLEQMVENPKTNQMYAKKIKIADLGNACWVDKHFTDDIQTRQYRSPEVIMGYRYDCSADIWSLGCIVFEMVTGDLLFKPKKGEKYSKSEDHLALILELFDMERFPSHMVSNCKKKSKYFTRSGELKNINELHHWSLERVFREKYSMDRHEAREITKFLTPILEINPKKRATAQQILESEWLEDADTSIHIYMP